jgi:hypothetical protein
VTTLWLVASPSAAAGAEGHHCRCETVCSGHCCCVKKDRAVATHAAEPLIPAAESSVDESGPCLCGAPCGGGFPDAPVGSPIAKPTALHALAIPALAISSQFFVTGASVLHPLQIASRLEDPPEPPAGA